MTKHEDDRRILISVPYENGEMKTIFTKETCTLGNHYHKIKTEKFRLVAGFGIANLNDKEFKMYPDMEFEVTPNTKHSFVLDQDTILNCICSHPYDPTDDYE